MQIGEPSRSGRHAHGLGPGRRRRGVAAATAVVEGLRWAGAGPAHAQGLRAGRRRATDLSALAAAGIEILAAGESTSTPAGPAGRGPGTGPRLRFRTADGRMLTLVLGEAWPRPPSFRLRRGAGPVDGRHASPVITGCRSGPCTASPHSGWSWSTGRPADVDLSLGAVATAAAFTYHRLSTDASLPTAVAAVAARWVSPPPSASAGPVLARLLGPDRPLAAAVAAWRWPVWCLPPAPSPSAPTPSSSPRSCQTSNSRWRGGAVGPSVRRPRRCGDRRRRRDTPAAVHGNRDGVDRRLRRPRRGEAGRDPGPADRDLVLRRCRAG